MGLTSGLADLSTSENNVRTQMPNFDFFFLILENTN